MRFSKIGLMGAPMSTRDAVTALRRFGLGARAGEIKSVATDPRGFLLQAIRRFDPGKEDAAGLRPSYAHFEALQVQQRERRLAQQQMPKPAESTPPTPQPAPAPPEAKPPERPRDVLLEEATQRLARAMKTETPLVERLVMFWSNHFCISADKSGAVRVMAGAYEREAIRPHVLGRFRDMLMASAMHPAMILYLDNQQSMGPSSRAAKGKGLNENLAREILELHTLGSDGGYTQTDVTNFARILTGWTVGTLENGISEPGRFFYAPARHEPGDWSVLGKRYKDEGQLTGQRVLDDLSRHPSTARNIARKLVRHFVSDKAPPSLIERVQQSFARSDGDLAAVSRTLIESAEAWSTPPAKILPPADFLIAIARGFGLDTKPQDFLRFGLQLGQPLWRPPSPKGWPDEDEAWTAPSAMRERLRIAELAARLADKSLDPRQAAADLFADALSEHARLAIARAEVREQGLELLAMSPEFQRR